MIPALNEAAHIEACVRTLIEGDDAARAADIVVMDGGSSDGTCAIVTRLAASFPNVRLGRNPGRIQSCALNRAALNADADILIRCDAHSLYPPRYVSRLIEAMERTGADSVVVPMDAVGEGCFQRAAAWIVDTPLGSGGSAHRGGVRSSYVDHGHHAAFKLARFRELGGYDETFTHNEDAEYDRRLTQAGGKVWLDADIRIGYFPRATARALWRQYWNYGAGRARTLLKHRAAPRLRQVVPVLNFALLALSLASAAFVPLTLVWPAFYLGVLFAASLFVAAKHKSPCGLGAGLALAIIHNAWALGFITTWFGRTRKEGGA